MVVIRIVVAIVGAWFLYVFIYAPLAQLFESFNHILVGIA